MAIRASDFVPAAVEFLDLDDLSKVSAACQAMNAYVLQSSTLQTLLQRKVLAEAERTKRNLTEVESALAAAKAEATDMARQSKAHNFILVTQRYRVLESPQCQMWIPFDCSTLSRRVERELKLFRR
eukprot:s3916_g2.t1